MSKKQELFTGAGGEHCVSSEFLIRGWNVATPDVDLGTDTFIVDDFNKGGKSYRIQIKTTFSKPIKKGLSFAINVHSTHIIRNTTPDMYYVFCVRDQPNENWIGNAYFSQDDLDILLMNNGIDVRKINKNLRPTFNIINGKLLYKGNSINKHWKSKGWNLYWKTLQH